MRFLIPWSSFKVLIMAILATSIAISMTGLYVFSISTTLVKSLTLGIREQVLIYSPVSRIPHTGLISDVMRELAMVEGVAALSSEVLTPIIINDRLTFLRGLNLTLLGSFINYSLSGRQPIDDSEVVVGIRLSMYLNISVGQVIEIVSIPANSIVKVVVSGILKSSTSLDDEVLCSLNLSQKLRGVSNNYVTLVRVKVSDACINSNCLGKVLSGLGSPKIPFRVVSKVLSNRSLSDVELVDEFLGRGVGVVNTLLWASILLVLTVSTPAIYFGTLRSLDGLTPILETLRFVGLSRVKIALMLVFRALSVGSVLGVLGYLISSLILYILLTAIPVKIILHTVELVNDVNILVISMILPSITSSIAVCLRVKDV